MSDLGSIKYEEGLTWRSALAIVYSSVVIYPVAVYLSLSAGVALSTAAVYITVLLFTEIARYLRSPLKRQEVFIMYMLVGSAATFSPFIDIFVFRGYYRNSDVAMMFRDPYTGKPLPYIIPSWWAPVIGSRAYETQALTHPDWLLPILIWVIWFTLAQLVEISLAFIIAQLYIEIEKLPFPIAAVDSEICITLSEREPQRLKVFSLSSLIGILWATPIYLIPMISTFAFGIPIPIPVPWIDFSKTLEIVLPGACFALASDLIPYATGFVVPFRVAVSMFIGSYAIWVFGNNLALHLPDIFPGWVDPKTGWLPGMSTMAIYQRSMLWVWVNLLTGFAIGTAIFAIARGWRYFVRMIKSLMRLTETSKRAGYLPLPVLLAIFIGTNVGFLILLHYLAPDFPLLVAAVLLFGWSFIFGLVNGRAIGETGYRIDLPYDQLWNLTVLATGYPKIDAWFATPYIGGYTCATWAQTIKVAQLTNTKPSSFFKAYLLFLPFMALMSYTYTHLFLMLSPMPSYTYMMTAIGWPVRIMISGLWVSRQVNVFRPELIAGAAIAMAVTGIVIDIAQLPVSIIGLVTGFNTLPHISTAILIGALIGRYALSKRFGQEAWRRLRAVIVAGMATGEGVVVGIGAALAMITKSMWILPY
jgi:hypothetical protein